MIVSASCPSRGRLRQGALVGALGGILVLAGCAEGQQSPIGLGSAAGAVGAGTLAGVAMRNKGPVAATAAVLGAGLLGGYLGDRYIDEPSQQKQQQQKAAAADADYQRKLDYERQSQLQQAEVQKDIQEKQLYDQWKAERTGGAMPGAINTPANTSTAQRLLTALGYYRGPIDGVYGPATRSAVMQFEDSQGLPRTGDITPSIVGRMKSAVAA
jgi:hypothetical protein